MAIQQAILPEGVQLFYYNQPFELEMGGELKGLQLAYHCFGTLSETKDNVVWITHALTANSNVVDWWKGLVGEGCAVDTNKYFVVCANVIGSFYGSTNPCFNHPDTGKPYGMDFPFFTVRDVVKAHDLLRQHLEIDSIKIAIGGSFGGHQVLEMLCAQMPIQKAWLLATSARETAWSIAIHESQRMAMEADASFVEVGGGRAGMKTARAIGLISYRTIPSYIAAQTDKDIEKVDDFRASSYVRYQGEKLDKRFNPHCYWYLSKCLDSHNVGRGRGSIEKALGKIKTPVVVLAIRSDMLIPQTEQAFLAKYIPNAQYVEIDSAIGHDGFLTEIEQLTKVFQTYVEV